MKQPKPFFRKQTRTWYVQLGKRQFNRRRQETGVGQVQFKNVVPRQLAPLAVVFVLSLYVRLLLEERGKTDAGPLVFFFKDYGFRELVPRKQAPNALSVSTSKEADAIPR